VRSRLLLALASLVCAVFLACNSSSYLESDTATKEARIAAENYWLATLTKCGDDSYSDEDAVITVYKNFDYNLRDLPLSQSDRNNGVNWRMRTAIQAGTPYRTWDPSHKQWAADWSNVGVTGPSVEIEKRNGKVFYRETTEVESTAYHPKKLDCSVLPK